MIETRVKNLWKLLLLTSIFIGSLVIANVIVSKIIAAFWYFCIPGGVIAYAVTFLMTDTICEVWGKKIGNLIVAVGFLAQLVVLCLTMVTLKWPAAGFWKNQAAFESILGIMPRIVLASLIAYLVSQFHDIWAFHKWKTITKGKHLWIRNNASTMVSQFIDSVIFVTIAFAGVMPVQPLVLGQWVFKLIIAAIDTPFVYGLVNWAKK